MMESPKARRELVPPKASVLIESMRDIGYSLQTAIADVIDNSITAEARCIEILAETHSDNPAIGILDDGVGMTEKQLLEAMRPGSRSPRDKRRKSDLGRFGLGLKTASFSQCRRLTVVTRQKGTSSCAIWDLDEVAESNEWAVELPSDLSSIPWAEKLGERGTLIVWQKLDRLVDRGGGGDQRRYLMDQIDGSATHVQLVFHRFMTGDSSNKSVDVLLNGHRLIPFDPFNSRSKATQLGDEEVFLLGGHEIRIMPVTLPHHKKVDAAEWNLYAGPEGYTRNQGFYLYRNRRLIVHGTWFGLARQTELTKLSRVRIDIPNSLDSEWKIDVKKASAQPPGPVRERLRRLIAQIGATSKRAYTSRGARLFSDSRLPVWTRNQSGNQVSYGLNAEHPLFASFSDRLVESMQREFKEVIDLIVSSFPIDTLVADIGSSPETMTTQSLDEDEFTALVKSTYLPLKHSGYSDDDIELMMSTATPYRENWTVAKRIIADLQKENA